jgi:hypothetical protein
MGRWDLFSSMFRVFDGGSTAIRRGDLPEHAQEALASGKFDEAIDSTASQFREGNGELHFLDGSFRAARVVERESRDGSEEEEKSSVAVPFPSGLPEDSKQSTAIIVLAILLGAGVWRFLYGVRR